MTDILTVVLLIVMAALAVAALLAVVKGVRDTMAARHLSDEEKRRLAASRRWGNKNRGGSGTDFHSNLHDF